MIRSVLQSLRTAASRSYRVAILATLSALLIAACSGGAETTDNPLSQNLTDPGSTAYSGEVARDDDVLKFQQEFWAKTRSSDRCGACHNEVVGQVPMFARNDNVNDAYDAAIGEINREQPSQSPIVAQVSQLPLGHGCWVDDPGVCGSIMTTWIENWVGETADGGREIVLTAPNSENPGDSKNFPMDADSFQLLIHEPILEPYCSGCHSSQSPTAQQPYFADPDVNSAYEAAKSKINLDTPADSRFVVKLSPVPFGESHN
ncbi:MAG: hypothetical protein KJO27_06895, partial [Gammaproteobacteria bacterium]|nr:hypothetical protein [Gammaproteobacteria bacterium]NNL45136.1 hypothetical protein [Woeseiaceae bacterium]